MRISYVKIENYRNFKNCEVELGQNIILVGENKAGKSNFIEAIRLVLDPNLSDSDRQLTAQDFWDGDGQVPFNGREIRITLRFTDFADENSPEYLPLSWLSDCLIPPDSQRTAQLTYWYYDDKKQATAQDDESEEEYRSGQDDYDFKIYPGETPEKDFNIRGMRRDIPLYLIGAIRDIASDTRVWRSSPLNRLIKLTDVESQLFDSYATEIRTISEKVVEEVSPLKELDTEIQERLKTMVGEIYTIEPSLGLSATTPESLLETLQLFVDGVQRRSIDRTSLGLQNVLYLSLLSLLLEKREIKRRSKREPFIPIVALEESEAHLHPHLQRLVFSHFLQEAHNRKQPVIITTHSPHLATSANIEDLVLLKDHGSQGCKARSAYTFVKALEPRSRKDLDRFLDITKSEMLFAQGVIFVEGDVEVLLLDVFAEILGKHLDKYGISVCNVYGAHFAHVITLAEELNIPFLVLTDGDKFNQITGLERAIDFLQIIKPNRQNRLKALYDRGRTEKVRSWLKKSGIFVNDWTLEPELVKAGLSEELKQTFIELGDEISQNVRAGVSHVDTYLADETDENMKKILTSINDTRWRKGRFAQRLLKHIKNKADSLATQDEKDALVPGYIREGFEYLLKRVQV